VLEAWGGDLEEGVEVAGLRVPFLLLKSTAVRRLTPAAGEGLVAAFRSGGWSNEKPCRVLDPTFSSARTKKMPYMFIHANIFTCTDCTLQTCCSFVKEKKWRKLMKA
jgi:hypothetical protein